jgi:hypothetical protein
MHIKQSHAAWRNGVAMHAACMTQASNQSSTARPPVDGAVAAELLDEVVHELGQARRALGQAAALRVGAGAAQCFEGRKGGEGEDEG